jgi:hypothetical protein
MTDIRNTRAVFDKITGMMDRRKIPGRRG